MKKNSTKGITPEQAAELAARIIPAGDDEATRALISLVSAIAALPNEETRTAVAVAVVERAYTRSNEYGDNLLAFLTAAEFRAEYECAPMGA